MAEKKFSELPSAASLTGNELAAMSQMQSGSLASVKSTLQAIANWFAVYAQYTTALQTTDKTIAGAINELKQLISLIPQFSIEVVQVLPTEDISDTTIYLVPAEDPEVGNYYEEYIHVNNTWELVGTTAVDLSGYYTKLEVDGLLANKASVADLALKENKSDMPTDVRTIIKDCKTPKNATITNGIAQFECIEENLVKGLKVTMNPIQDLHGQSAPYPAGGGKNKLPFDINAMKLLNTAGTWNGNVYTYRGIDYTIYDDGTVDANGTASGGTSTLRYCTFDLGGNYKVTGLPYSGSISTIRIILTNEAFTQALFTLYSPDDNDVTLNSGAIYGYQITISSGVTVNHEFWDPMIRLATETDPTFAPYSNICPISGRTEASIVRTGKNVFNLEKYLTDNNITYTKDGEWFIFSIGSALYANKFTLPELGYYSGQLIIDSTRTVATNVNLRTYKNGSAVTQGQTFTNQQIDQVGFNYSTTGQVCCKVQTEYGASNTTYEPYTAETKTHQYQQEILGGVDDFVNGGLSNEWNLLTPTSVSTMGGGSGTNIFFRINIPNSAKGINTASLHDQPISNYFFADNTANHVLGGAFITSQGTSLHITFADQTIDTVEKANTYLTNNPFQVCYKLATPTTIETSAEEINTVAGTNIISGTEPISECKYTELATVDDLRKIIGGQ